jgi:hypothetical protein
MKTILLPVIFVLLAVVVPRAAEIPNPAIRYDQFLKLSQELEPVNFARKCMAVALNVQTFVNLHAYGYTNVFELGPLLDVKTTRIPFGGSAVLPSR